MYAGERGRGGGGGETAKGECVHVLKPSSTKYDKKMMPYHHEISQTPVGFLKGQERSIHF